MILFDLFLRYDDETLFRPYVSDCELFLVGHYAQHVANLAHVEEISIRIHPATPTSEFHKYTL